MADSAKVVWENHESRLRVRRCGTPLYVPDNPLSTRLCLQAHNVWHATVLPLQAQMQGLESQGKLPNQTDIDTLSPCIMRKVGHKQLVLGGSKSLANASQPPAA
jgi:hypothetical protein